MTQTSPNCAQYEKEPIDQQSGFHFIYGLFFGFLFWLSISMLTISFSILIFTLIVIFGYLILVSLEFGFHAFFVSYRTIYSQCGIKSLWNRHTLMDLCFVLIGYLGISVIYYYFFL